MRLLALLVLTAALAVAAGPAAASTRTGPCRPGDHGDPCHFQTAKVVAVDDGDTVTVDLDGDHSRRTVEVRFRAVQAMELTRYASAHRAGQCHAVEAADRVEQLMRASHWRVRLSAQHPSTDHRGRLLRWIAVRRAGHWADVGTILMREGHTLWMDNPADHAFNTLYDRLGQQSAAAHRGLFDTTHCGVGPQQEVPIRVWANWDPAGRDTAAGEWVRIQNRSATTPLRLGGWWVRDAMLRRFTFPAATTVAPGATLTLHVGGGIATAQDLFWGLPTPIFENAGNGGDLGDGAYLFDPQGDLRSWMLYPCMVACADPYQGAIAVTAQPRRPERVLVTNRSGAPVDLYGYALRISGSTYAFPEGTVVGAGQTLSVWMGGDPSRDGGLDRYWGRDGYVLPDGGGWAEVTTFSDVRLACDAWGGRACP